jgi:hypothetical protein
MSTSKPGYSPAEWAVVVILRIVGIAAILAIPAVLFLYSWMNAIHARLGLGIDLYSGMPEFWTLAEGPFTIVIGAVVLWLLRMKRNQLDVE